MTTAMFGTADVRFDTEADARAFLLGQAFVQIQVPRGRVFMHMIRPTRVEITESPEGGWAVIRTDGASP